jgi:hypothetical protein
VRRRQFLALTAASPLLAACADTSADPAPVIGTSAATPAATPAAMTARRTPKPPSPAGVRADELGMIPVLMHHRLVASRPGTYDMTADFFRAELDRLHRENYYPIRTIDLVRRDLATVPAGKTPVVLTFDDSTPGQVAFDASGNLTPGCALGILQAFHRRHPDFPAVATFYVNKSPFGLSGQAATKALIRLDELGCEVGNHTWSHPNLRALTRADAEAEIGRLAALIAQATPDTPARTMALPLGAHPRDSSVLIHGGSGRTAYRNLGVLLVGANPCHSPFHREFNPMAVPRIRCSSADGDLELTYWLDRLAATKYVAAGNPNHVTAPRAQQQAIAPAFRTQAIWY